MGFSPTWLRLESDRDWPTVLGKDWLTSSGSAPCQPGASVAIGGTLSQLTVQSKFGLADERQIRVRAQRDLSPAMAT